MEQGLSMVYGIISGQRYFEEDIFNPIIYPKMKDEPLLNNDDCLVVPVRNERTPHFRRIGNPSFIKRLGRDENNPTHDKCVRSLFDKLTSPEIDRIQFSTYIFGENREEQVIFKTIDDSKYIWFMENDCRTAFGDETYIKPDLAGRDSTRFFPRSAYPNIIIEVVRTHIPSPETFQKLFELSLCNHQIYFYFIAEGKESSKVNHVKTEEKILTIRVSHYLIGGKVFKNGEEYSPKRDSETIAEWYNHLKNSYFIKAKENA
ncbi:hypothetical protein [Cellvibrio mixtus]|uniref:hypothetical protein n=1 Tax=Cellvibrio mixtus TaxID=39650 RepID=UPI00190F0B62|nr:hypothetical protein [Cellvibrio mixtus]